MVSVFFKELLFVTFDAEMAAVTGIPAGRIYFLLISLVAAFGGFLFGYDTAVSIATECIDRLHTTAESHHRTLVVEIMGRHAGWITCASGIAGGADMILVPRPIVGEPIDQAKLKPFEPL